MRPRNDRRRPIALRPRPPRPLGHTRALVLLGGVLALCVRAPIAHAYEDQITLGFDGGYALALKRPDTGVSRHGAAAGVSLGWGLNDAWSLAGRLGYTVHPRGGTRHTLTLGVEATYSLDVVRFVPFAGFGVDGLLSRRGSSTDGDFAVHALLGVDYLWSRRVIFGLDVRTYILPFGHTDPLDPAYLVATLRVSLVFDRF